MTLLLTKLTLYFLLFFVLLYYVIMSMYANKNRLKNHAKKKINSLYSIVKNSNCMSNDLKYLTPSQNIFKTEVAQLWPPNNIIHFINIFLKGKFW